MQKRKMDVWIWAFAIGTILSLAVFVNPGLTGNMLQQRDAGLFAAAFLILIGFRILYARAKPSETERKR